VNLPDLLFKHIYTYRTQTFVEKLHEHTLCIAIVLNVECTSDRKCSVFVFKKNIYGVFLI